MLLAATHSTAALSFFLGAWLCHRGGPHPRDVRTTVTAAVGGVWLKAETYSAKSIDPNRPFIGTQYLAYSAVSKRYVTMNLNNFGGYWIEESPGWVGNRIIWHDDSTEDGERGVTTITRLSDSSYRVHEDLMRNGKLEAPVPDVVCRRR